jgi:hypothetical protein
MFVRRSANKVRRVRKHLSKNDNAVRKLLAGNTYAYQKSDPKKRKVGAVEKTAQRRTIRSTTTRTQVIPQPDLTTHVKL